MEKLNIEIWKDVVGYEGLYQVSNFGNIRSCDKIIKREGYRDYVLRSKLLKQSNHSEGYLVICLTRNSKYVNKFVHQIVADAFIPLIKDSNDINHIDGNKKNNCVSNLERCTRKENINHAYQTLKRKSNTIITSKLTLKVKELKANSLTNREIAKQLNISHTTVNKMLNLKT